MYKKKQINQREEHTGQNVKEMEGFFETGLLPGRNKLSAIYTVVCVCVCVCVCTRAQLCLTLCDPMDYSVDHYAPLSMELSRQEHWRR